MLNFSTLLAGNNLWTTLINVFAKWIVSYGWAIIVFTIVLKLVLSPLDILQRISSQKQTRVMNAMQPELAALQKKYGNDKDKLNAETNKLYKKYNTGLGGSCLIMLVTMVLNIVIVFSLFGAVRSFGNDKLYESYRELDNTYVAAYDSAKSDSKTDEDAQTIALEVTKEKYDELKKQNGWLWVKNVWKSDTRTSQFVSFDDYANHERIYDDEETGSKARTEAKARYDTITVAIGGDNQQNGYYVLIILAVAVSFLTQFLSAKLLQPKGQKMNMTSKIMFAIIPLTMFILAINSNVVYTLYIIANSVMAAIISTIISLIMRKRDKKYEGNAELLLKKKNVEVVEYSRNYKK